MIFVPLAPSLGVNPIVVIAFATLAGGLGQVLLQWPAARREGLRYEPIVDIRDPWLREIVRLMLPGVAGLAALQVNLFVNSWLAASLGTGAVSWLDYAFRLMYLPIGLFGISIATASLPSIAGHAARQDDPGVRRAISSGLRMMLMLNVPAMAGLIALAGPIVALIFQRGMFTAADTAATAAALACYAPGLVGYSAVKLISPAFYAMGDSRTPLIASGVSICLEHRAQPAAGTAVRPLRPGARHRNRSAAEFGCAALARFGRSSEASRAAGCRPRWGKSPSHRLPWHSLRTMPNGCCTCRLAVPPCLLRLFVCSAPLRPASRCSRPQRTFSVSTNLRQLRRRVFTLLNVVDSSRAPLSLR